MRGHLGRLAPPNFDHVDAWPFSALGRTAPAAVERELELPSWMLRSNQGNTGTCVGHGSCHERSIANLAEVTSEGGLPAMRYNPIHEYVASRRRAGEDDPWDLDAGWYVHKIYDTWRDLGGWPVADMTLDGQGIPQPVGEHPHHHRGAGVSTTRWARSPAEIRNAISEGIAVTVGVNWYTRFDSPVNADGESWAARPGDLLGTVRGGHSFAFYANSDEREALKFVNSWGPSYPPSWMPWTVVARLLSEQGEAALVTDR